MKQTSAVYERLSNLRLIAKSYSLKFLFIAFLGIHIPLLGIILYLLLGPTQLNAVPIFFVVLALTLGATAITLYLLNGLLSPLHHTKHALEQYLGSGTLPQLPVYHTDEAGVLMQKVQQSLTELDNMLQEKKDIASLLSHDLKQPLALIGTSAELIESVDDPVIIKRFCGNIKKLVKEQLVMLEDVLELLQCDHIIKQPETKVNVAVPHFVGEIIKSSQIQASIKGIEIEHQADYAGSVAVHSELLRQVLKNLLHNAIKFSYPHTKINVIVEAANNTLMFKIKDQGMGFKPDLQATLFDRFTKASQRGTNDEPSTGIGLHICKKIVQLHGGNIEAYSEGVDKGATFTIAVPLLPKQAN